VTEKPIKIVIVEDETAHIEAIRRAMEASGEAAEIRAAASLGEYRRILQESQPDIALVDMNLPDGSALEITSQLPEAGTCPMIIMTSYGNEQIAVEAMKAGALDYVVKSPEAFAAMPRTIVRALREWSLLQERRRAEEDLRRSEEKYRELVENLNDVVFSLDAQGIITYASPPAMHIAGYRPADLLGHPFSLIIHDEDYPYVAQSFLETLNNKLAPAEFRFRTADGSVRWARTSSRPLFEGGQAVGIFGIFSDITERKQSEEKIRHLNLVLRAIRKVNQLITLEKDSHRLIAEICSHLVEHRGYEGAVIILTDDSGGPLSFFEAGMGEGFLPLAEHLRQGILPPCCDEARLNDGLIHIKDQVNQCASCPIIARCARQDTLCIQMRHGTKIYGYLSVSLDRMLGIDTEEQELFAEVAGDVAFGLYSIEQSKMIMEADRERRRMETELRQAQKMDAIGKLAGGVAHDFNNMLSVIIGFSTLAMEGLHPMDPLCQDLAEIRKAGERSADLTKQLLAFSRKQVVEPRIIILDDVVAEHKKMLGRLIGEDIELLFKPAENLWKARLDPSQVGQVLANLSVNARDAIRGVGKVTIETANATLDQSFCSSHISVTPGDYVILSFSDTGIGMDEETLEHLFEPFFTTKKAGEGTGLGLSTVFGIVKQNEGHILVSSTPGAGATFTIYFPRYQGQGEKAPERDGEVNIEGTETILLVEDEEHVLKIARKVLELHGYKVLSAATPGEACIVAEKYNGDIHLLLTDVIMPLMNGKELQARIEKIRPRIRTLFMSGYTADIIVQRGLIEEGVIFIQKPFSPPLLARKVRLALES
jgi:two-component system, cell cycle sensor histidine kinase and response regulator CckA